MRRLMLNCTFFVQLLYGIFSIFFDYFYLFGTPMVKQKFRETFFSQGSSEKQKRVYKLFLSNSRIEKHQEKFF